MVSDEGVRNGELTSVEDGDLSSVWFPEVLTLVESPLGRAPLGNVGVPGVRHDET